MPLPSRRCGPDAGWAERPWSVGRGTITRARSKDAPVPQLELISCADLVPELAEIRRYKQ
jgi:hypothetical protein